MFGKPNRRGAGVTRGVDVVVNYTGGDTWVKSLRCLKVGGRVLICGATAGYAPTEDLRYIWAFELNIKGSNGYRRDDIVLLLDMVRQGEVQGWCAGGFLRQSRAAPGARSEDPLGAAHGALV